MSLTISHRAAEGSYTLPEDGYHQIVPFGEFPHKPSGLTQVIDTQSVGAIMNAFQADKNRKATNDDDCVLLVDYDHFSGDPDKPSTAAGWVQNMQLRSDGLYAEIAWTADAQRALTSGTYRFISPSFKPDEIEFLSPSRVRPLRLDRAGITNDPNMKGMRPLSNRERAGGRSIHTLGFAFPLANADARYSVLSALAGNGLSPKRKAVSFPWAAARMNKTPPGFMGRAASQLPLSVRMRKPWLCNRAGVPSIANAAKLSLLTPGEKKLVDEEEVKWNAQMDWEGDLDALRIPQYVPGGREQIRDIFLKVVKKFAREGMDFRAAWMKAKARNPVAWSCYMGVYGALEDKPTTSLWKTMMGNA